MLSYEEHQSYFQSGYYSTKTTSLQHGSGINPQWAASRLLALAAPQPPTSAMASDLDNTMMIVNHATVGFQNRKAAALRHPLHKVPSTIVETSEPEVAQEVSPISSGSSGSSSIIVRERDDEDFFMNDEDEDRVERQHAVGSSQRLTQFEVGFELASHGSVIPD